MKVILSKIVEAKGVEYLIQSQCDGYSLWLVAFIYSVYFQQVIFQRRIIFDLEKDTFEIEKKECDQYIGLSGSLKSDAENLAEETFKLLKKVNKMKAFL